MDLEGEFRGDKGVGPTQLASDGTSIHVTSPHSILFVISMLHHA